MHLLVWSQVVVFVFGFFLLSVKKDYGVVEGCYASRVIKINDIINEVASLIEKEKEEREIVDIHEVTIKKDMVMGDVVDDEASPIKREREEELSIYIPEITIEKNIYADVVAEADAEVSAAAKVAAANSAQEKEKVRAEIEKSRPIIVGELNEIEWMKEEFRKLMDEMKRNQPHHIQFDIRHHNHTTPLPPPLPLPRHPRNMGYHFLQDISFKRQEGSFICIQSNGNAPHPFGGECTGCYSFTPPVVEQCKVYPGNSCFCLYRL